MSLLLARTGHHSRPRRWRVPPAITRGPNEERLEGTAILREIQGPLGLLLWEIMRDVQLWATAEPGMRDALFTSVAAERRRQLVRLSEPVPSRVSQQLDVFERLLTQPGSADERTLSVACTVCAAWARDTGLGETALALAQAAAHVWPSGAAPALKVGHLARAQGQLVRAETWLRRAIRLATRTRDGRVSGEAHLALGELLVGRGDVRSARGILGTAMRTIRRHGLGPLRIRLHWALSNLEAAAGNEEAAEHHAQVTLRAADAGHPAYLPAIVAVARGRLRRGETAEATALLSAAMGEAGPAAAPLPLVALLAYAASWGEDLSLASSLWFSTLARLHDAEPTPEAAIAARDLARAAVRANQHGLLPHVGSVLAGIAAARGDAGLKDEAERMKARTFNRT